MSKLSYKWEADGSEHAMELVGVPGTEGKSFLFGRGANRRPVEVSAFYIATTPCYSGAMVTRYGIESCGA